MLPILPVPEFDPSVYYYDEKAVLKVVRFFTNVLRHIDGELIGQPIVPLDWMLDMIVNVYGVKVIATKKRRYNIVWIEIPRKNAKSFAVAGISLYELCFGEHRGEIIVCAKDRKQATTLFEIAKDMVKASPLLRKAIKVESKELYNPKNNSTFWVASRDADSLQGPNPSVGILDEVHVQPDSKLWDAFTQGQSLRSQPLLFGITTAGIVSNDNFAYQKHSYAEQVIKGIIKNDTVYAKMYGVSADADWRLEENWIKANPIVKNVPSKLNMLRTLFEGTKYSKTEEWAFRRFSLNQWLSNTNSWLTDEDWMPCKTEFDIKEFYGCEVYVGIDLGETQDLSAMVLVCIKNDEIYLYLKTYCAEESIENRSKMDKVPYMEWVEDGILTATPGKITDYDQIKNDLNEYAQHMHIKQIAMDRWGAGYFMQKLVQDGFDVVKFSQAMSFMSAPTKLFERLVLQQKIKHNGNKIMRWSIPNVVLSSDSNGNIKPDKKKSREKIDPVVAAIMAVEICNNSRLSGPLGGISWT